MITWRFYEWLLNQKELTSKWFWTPLRLTFSQSYKEWLRIMKWQKWTKIIFRELRDTVDDTWDKATIPYKKHYTVFNIEQCCMRDWSPLDIENLLPQESTTV